jgi:hypothetical protein
LISIESTISPFLTDQLDVEATIRSLDKDENKTNSKLFDTSEMSRHNFGEVRSNLEQFDFPNEQDNRYDNQGQYGNRYYREFNLKNIIPHKFPEYEENSKRLNEIFTQILNNPYNVIIGDLYIELDPNNAEIMTAELPIQYSLRNLLSHKLLTDLPHEKYLAENDNVIIQFSNHDFIFDEILMEKLALMQFQVMPVIFFNNKIGRPQIVILDSWNEKYEGFKSYNISIRLENQFKPLFSVTPGTDQVQFTLNTGTLEAVYRFTIPSDKIGDYTKVTVKFMQESELDELLEGSYRGG